MMLAHLETRAAALGYQTLQLDTTTLQVAAQQLYRKNGFTQREKTETIQGLTVLFFEKNLLPNYQFASYSSS
ncbi:GNAT family N-acetyltransferase [Dictyobacter formicarum]|uniref:N-acetyltransferase domain-containing protein n=1 Tax=Dictyobacter formicarum TaxID=2778368 RepID=A0ABQ3VB53_9CHLR|nr:hypothetical protein KSZ_04470 [Dictyobacter formicarum]